MPDVCYTEFSGKNKTHLYGLVTQDGCFPALGTSPAQPAPASSTPTHKVMCQEWMLLNCARGDSGESLGLQGDQTSQS